jgi:Cu2+-exporting ATPase
LSIAAAIAAHSTHPYSQALADAAPRADIAFDSIVEHPGLGLEARAGAEVWRLGRAEWALESNSVVNEPGTVLSRNGRLVQSFSFDDAKRPGARQAIASLINQGLMLEVVSGDRPDAVRRLAAELGINTVQAGVLPAEKVAHVRALGTAGLKVLMVGDGINDAPALAAAHASIAPANAADIGRQASDFVFLRQSLDAVPVAIGVSLAAKKLIKQNFTLAVAYNLVALPVAIAGLVTPLIAALAMSGSSILVVANALRLKPRRVAGDGLPGVSHASKESITWRLKVAG